MAQHPTPRWQPIAQLPRLASLRDGVLASVQAQYQGLLDVRSQLDVLDDDTLGRVSAAVTAQRHDRWRC